MALRPQETVRARVSSSPPDLSNGALLKELRSTQAQKKEESPLIPQDKSNPHLLSVTVKSNIGSLPGSEVFSVNPSDKVSIILDRFLEKFQAPASNNYILRDKYGLIVEMNISMFEAGINHADVLELSTKDSDPPIFSYTSWWKIALLCGILSLSICGGVFASYMSSTPQPYTYSVVLDAGSVHTSVYLYRFGAKQRGTGLIEQVSSCTVGLVGISSFQTNPVGVREYIDSKCVRETIAIAHEKQDVLGPLILAGTAGMRNLKLMSPDSANWIMGNISQKLQSMVGDRGVNIKILSGQTEGISGWVTTNYLMNTFHGMSNADYEDDYVDDRVAEQSIAELDFHKLQQKSWNAEETFNTFGALDWGGASAQITVEVPEELANYNIRLYGKTYNVYTASHLCYGQKMSVFRHRALLVYEKFLAQGYAPRRIQDPCAPRGSKVRQSAKGLFGAACTQLVDTNFMDYMREMAGKIEFVGSTNHSDCRLRVEEAFNYELCRSRFKQYSSDTVCLDSIAVSYPANSQFYAFSAYWYLTNSIGLKATHSMSRVNERLEDLCYQNRMELLDSGVEEYKVDVICFRTEFMRALLTKGYHFNPTTYKQIKFVNSPDGNDFGWTLGNMIITSNDMPNLWPKVYISDMMIVVLLCIAFALSVLAAFFGYQSCMITRGSRKYQRLDKHQA